MSGALRAHVGKKDAKRIRKEGRVPCVIYGGKEQLHFSLDERDFSRVIFTPEVFLIRLTIDGKEFDSVLQEIQYHPVTDEVLHADFIEVIEGKPIAVALPVKLSGNPVGVVKGGRLFHKKRRVKVKGLVADIPEDLTLDISQLDLNDSIKIRDLEEDNLEFMDEPNSVVVFVKMSRGAGMAEEEEAEEEVEEEGAAEEGAEEKPAAEGEAPASEEKSES